MTKINLTTEKYNRMCRKYFMVQRNKLYKRKKWEKNELEKKEKKKRRK